MKKILSATCAMMLASAGMMANAQQAQTQLPNVGFDAEGWKEKCGKTYSFPAFGNVEDRERPGIEPNGWNGSSVNQNALIEVVKQELVVREYKDDANKDSYVSMFNTEVGALNIYSQAPGYITLGTPWVAADMSKDNCDGGTYGGIRFTSKPDAIVGDFYRVDDNNVADKNEASHVIVYLWNGTYTSKIGKANKPSKDKDNVDRAILRNGDASSKGVLIASCDYTFNSTKNAAGEKGWQTLEIPLEYVSDENPEMMNVIISAGEYWDRNALLEGTKLNVDNVHFVYYSRLASITLNGEAITLEEGKYDYTVGKVLDFSEEDIAEAVKYTLEGKSQSANVSVSVEAENAVVKVVVSNVDADIDGKESHTYTFKYQKPEVEPVVEEYTGYLNVEMGGVQIEHNTQSTIEIQNYQNDYCTFLLPDLKIGGTLELGDIRIDNVEIGRVEGGNSYTGAVDDMVLHNDFLGDIHAKVELNGTIKGSDVKMDVNVIWYQDYPTNEVETPIKVSFTSAPLSSVESVAGDGVKVYAAAGCVVVEGAEGVAQVYTVDGKQVAAEAVNGKTEIALANGLYIVRVGNKVQKVVVK